MTSERLFTARRLSLGYRRTALVRDLSFDVCRGDILGIVGPNGCGKTTLLRTLLGLLKPLDGEIERQPGLAIGYVPQRERTEAILPATTLEVVLLGRHSRAGPLQRVTDMDRDSARRALAGLGAEPLAAQLFRDLSAGQQQRVLLARALAADPDVLVLDEPTSGMDPAAETGILGILRELNTGRGMTILLVTHLLPIVLNLATSIMLMGSHGILHGSVDDVLSGDRLTELYGVPMHLGVIAGRRTVVVG